MKNDSRAERKCSRYKCQGMMMTCFLLLMLSIFTTAKNLECLGQLDLIL